MLLVAVILIASPIRVLMQAHAIAVVDDAAAGIVALLLVAGGYTFANRDTLTECAWNLWQGMSGELKSGILSVATIWAENQGQVNIWKVSASLKNLFLDYLGNWYSIDDQSFVNVHTDQLSGAAYYITTTGWDKKSKIVDAVINPDAFYYRDLSTSEVHNFQVLEDNATISVLFDGIVTTSVSPFAAGEIGTIVPVGWWFHRLGNPVTLDYHILIKYAYQVNGTTDIKYDSIPCKDASGSAVRLSPSYLASFDAYAQQIYNFPVTVPDTALQDFKDLPDEPVLQLPATTNITNIYNSTYADVTSPSYQLPQDEIAGLTADVPTTTADTGTGEGTGAGTETGGILGTLQGLWDWLKSILQAILNGITAIPSALSGILDAILSFFDSPSNFSLNFEGFKNLILFNRFPFCIPFDLKNAISVFAANASDYKLSIDMDTAYFSVHQEIDLTPFALPIAFFRYGASVWFTIALILKTRELIKW